MVSAEFFDRNTTVDIST